MLFIGLTPASNNLSCIQVGDGATFTFLTPLAIYLLQSLSLTETFISSFMFLSHLTSNLVFGIL